MNDRHKKKPDCENWDVQTGFLPKRRCIVIGLTGGYGSGKTTVSGMFEALGAKVVSADTLAHEVLLKESDAWQEIVREFGEDILGSNGEIDRSRLGEVVFSDVDKRKRLESIVHPAVIRRLHKEADRFRKTCEGVLILEVPLLIETSSTWLVDKVIVVKAEQDTQITRLQKRYGICREDAIHRIETQVPLSEKISHADWIVDTDCSLDNTENEVASIWRSIQILLACG